MLANNLPLHLIWIYANAKFTAPKTDKGEIGGAINRIKDAGRKSMMTSI